MAEEVCKEDEEVDDINREMYKKVYDEVKKQWGLTNMKSWGLKKWTFSSAWGAYKPLLPSLDTAMCSTPKTN